MRLSEYEWSIFWSIQSLSLLKCTAVLYMIIHYPSKWSSTTVYDPPLLCMIIHGIWSSTIVLRPSIIIQMNSLKRKPIRYFQWGMSFYKSREKCNNNNNSNAESARQIIMPNISMESSWERLGLCNYVLRK